MSEGRTFLGIVMLLGLVMLCASAGVGQDRDKGNDGGNNGGGNTGRDRGDRDPSSRFGTTVTTPGATSTPVPIDVVPIPRRQTTKRPPRRKPVVVPGDRVVAMTDEVRQSDIHTPFGPGPFALTPEARPEYIAIGPASESDAAAAALVAAGATILRQRDYPNLGRIALIVDLQELSLPNARQVLTANAPGASLDIHSIYQFAKAAPRLFAAAMVNQPDSPACALSNDIRIGQIDGPVAVEHAALQGVGLTTYSVLDGSERKVSGDHGTAVATLLVGQDATGALTGFATGARLYAVSAFSRAGVSEASTVERIGAALDWLAGHQVHLINMSFAGPVNAALDDLLSGTAENGAILIAAAGNDGRKAAVYPAAADPVIGVTAVDAGLRRYRSANTGAHIEFAAPGVDLYVATADGGEYATGTSYAAPIVTGLAARLVADQVMSAPAMRARLQEQSVDLGDSGRDDLFGWGLVKSPGC